MIPFKHILTEMGVMKTFSVARRVSEDKVAILTNKYNKIKNKNISLDDFLKKEIINEMQDYFKNNKIPGMITKNASIDNKMFIPPTQEEQEMLIDLTQFSSLVAKKLVEKKLNKFYHCFVVHSIINMLHLSDKDFDEFYQKYSAFDDDESEDQESE
jgi:hypothetical protein